CHQANPDQAHFCMACGEDLTAQEIAAVTAGTIDHLANTAVVPLNPVTNIFTPSAPSVGLSTATKKSLAAIGILLLLLAGAGGVYHYYTQQMTQRFLSASSRLTGQMTASGQMLADYFAQPIDSHTIETLQQALPGQIQNLQGSVDSWNSVKCPEQYRAQKQTLARLAEIQLTVMGQIPDILAHPLAAETDGVLESLRQNIDEAQGISADMQLPGVQLPDSERSTVVADRLSAYCSQQREIHKAKLARLDAMNAYFKQMDSIIQKNNEAKTGLGTMLGQIRSGEYGWPDYFKMIDGARTTRESLRTQVNRLVTPAGTEEYTAELSRLLSLSINYCDIMKAGATSESKGDYEAANRKYIEAQTLNDQIQSQYTAFNGKYQTGKATLTNIDNL
ncbi:MAG: hypothetical protein ABRQ24_11625, partial [Syntrophomonadaceae bacterium]